MAIPSAASCPPSCANNDLMQLFDAYCSDKGSHHQSRHHYGAAYHSLFAPLRQGVRAMLEIGIGDDTAPSVASWAAYFPNANIFAVDMKEGADFKKRTRPGGPIDRWTLKTQPHCHYNRSMWQNPRVHLFLDTNASDAAQVSALPLPAELDIIIDDASHRYMDQEATLHLLWNRLAPGGFYIIEDLLVGALPWSPEHAAVVPTGNMWCGKDSEDCIFPQRPAEHPFMMDRFQLLTKRAAPRYRPLQPRTKSLLHHTDWFWAVTGVHRGGGLDASLILRKPGPDYPGTAPSTGTDRHSDRERPLQAAADGGSEGARAVVTELQQRIVHLEGLAHAQAQAHCHHQADQLVKQGLGSSGGGSDRVAGPCPEGLHGEIRLHSRMPRGLRDVHTMYGTELHLSLLLNLVLLILLVARRARTSGLASMCR